MRSRRVASRHLRRPLLVMCSVFLAVTHLTFVSGPQIEAARDSRPFWTEKSAFIEGDELFVVGIASKARTAEEGRQLAFQQGRVELMNYAQVTNLEAQGLVIETQMTYEEPQPDGTVSVFRLLRVPIEKLRVLQGRLQTQSKAQEQTLEQTRSELVAIQQSLTEKRLKIEEQQKKAEQLLQQLSMRPQSLNARSNETPSIAGSAVPLMDRLKEVETQLTMEKLKLETITRLAEERVTAERNRLQTKCRYLRKGMTQDEVEHIMGDPDKLEKRFGQRFLTYGKVNQISVSLNDLGALDSMFGCNANPGGFLFK